MARSFRRGRRTTPSSTNNSSRPLSPRAFRNPRAREANRNRRVRDANGTVYRDYDAYRRAVIHRRSREDRPAPVPTTGRSSSNTRSAVSDIFRDYRLRQVEQRQQEREQEREERLRALRGSNEVLATRAIQTGNPLLMRQAAITENIVLEEEGLYTSAYTQATDEVVRVLSGEYMYGVTQAEWDKWQELNTYLDTEQDMLGNEVKVRKLRFNAAPPPVGFNAEGETVDIENVWRYYQQVDFVRTKSTESRTRAEEDRASMYANHADQDMDTYNSNLDAFIGLITGHGLEGYKQFWSQYILKPLKYGNFSALGLNILNDLGETFDALPRAVKALHASQTMVYGYDTHWTNEEGTTFTNQEYWVYSGGEEKQKQLIELGAMDILKASRYTSNQRAAAIQNIKDAGLWDEFKKFQEEYNTDYDRGSIGDALKEVGKAYTTHTNYDAHTGNLAADLVIELVSDPTLMVGVGKGVAKGVFKGMTDDAVTTALKAAGKDVSALDEATGLTLNNLSNKLMTNVMSKGTAEIKQLSSKIAEELRVKGVFQAYGAKNFEEALIRNTQRMVDEKAFTVVKSLYYADRIGNKIDTTLLKTVFAAPYLTVKTTVPLAKKGAQIGTAKYQVFKRMLAKRLHPGIVDPVTDTVPLVKADELLEKLKLEKLPQEHPIILGEYYDKIRRGVEHECNKIDNILSDNWETVDEMEQALNQYIREITGGKCNDFSAYLNKVESLNDSYPTLDDMVDLVKRQYDSYLDQKELMKNGYTQLYKRKAVSGNTRELPIIKEDKLIDKSKRLSGDLKKQWKTLAKTYADELPEAYKFKSFFMDTRKNVPTLKEARFVLEEILKEASYALAKGVQPEVAISPELLDLYNKLITTELAVDVQKHVQFNVIQKDKWAVFEEAISSTYFKKVLDIFTDPTSNVSKFIKAFSEQEAKTGSEWADKQVYELIEQLKSLDAFQTFKRKLTLQQGPLTDDQVYRVLDSLFNRDWVNPHSLTDVRGREMDLLLEKVNIGLAALDDTVSLALDSFRRTAIDFTDDIWGRYSSELQDPAIQARVRALLAGGHEDPVADVNVQILQTILRDPEAIAKYNELSRQQDVIFYDIETRGLNVDNHEITCIAMKTWDELPEDATLDDILTFLEKDGKYYQTYTDEKYLKEVISDDILRVNYKNRPDLADTREAMLPEYLKRFGARANGKTVTEQEMLNKVIKDLDDSFKNRSNRAPVLVAHNNNNFDANFLCRRMIANKTFPAHMRNLDEFIGQEQNTYKMLRAMFPESSLSVEQDEFIRRLVAEYAREVGRFSSTMRVFQPGRFVQSIQQFTKVDSTGDEVFRFAQDELAALRVEEIQKSFIDDIGEDSTIFAISPFHRTVDSVDDATLTKFFGESRLAEIRRMSDEEFSKLWLAEAYGRSVDGSDSLMRMSKDSAPADNIPYWGHRNINADTVGTYFNVIGQKVPQHVLMAMNTFAKACGTDITKRMKSNTQLVGRLEDFQAVITYVKSFAEQLEVYDDLAYLRYAQAPNTVEEAYVMAQRMYDMFTGTVRYEEAQKYINEGTAFDDIPEEVRGTVVALTKFKDDFDIGSVVSPNTKALLSNEGGAYHHQIFKDVTDENVYYLEQISENERLYEAVIGKYRDDEMYLETASIFYESNKVTKAKDLMLTNLLKRSREALERFVGYDKVAKETFKKECKTALGKMMEAQSAQIMGFVSKSERNLIEHLLYNNQVMVIATKGSDLHVSQVSDLMKLLENESEYIYHTVDHQGYLWVGLKKEWQDKIQVKNDARHVTGDTEMSFYGRAETYKRPRYGRIAMPEDALSDKAMIDYFRHTEEQVFAMSRGASAGSLGITHTMAKQQQLYNNAPKAFIDNTLDVEFTCNSRFWHNANYDMSIIGGYAERWKVGNQNDVDYLIATRKALEDTAKKTQAERMFVQGFFGSQEHLKIQDVFLDGMSEKEIAQAFKENTDMVCLSLRESSSTESGFYVSVIDASTVRGVQEAKAAGAIVVPYSLYNSLGEVINQSKAMEGFLKVYSKMVHLYKVGYLFSPGTWMRNFIDGTIKAIGDTGDPVGLLSNYINAANMLRKYKNATEIITAKRGVSHNTMADLERSWDTLGTQLSFQEYKFMDEWMSRAESGGESAMLKLIKAHRGSQDVTKLVRKRNDGFDLVDDSLFKFEQLTEKEASTLFRKAELGEEIKMSEAEFLGIFSKRIDPTPAQRIEYESAAKIIMSKKFTYKHTLGSATQVINDKMLSPMSGIEEMVRLGEFMTLEAQGFTKSQIFNRISKTHFNYNLKSPAARHLELVIPFYSFMSNNLVYWCKQVSENPRMLRYIEKIWGELSWDTSDYSPEEIQTNYSLQHSMLSGNIPLSDTGFMFKVNLSCMDAFKFMYSPIERLYSNLFQPIQNKVQDVVRGSDARFLFGEQIEWSDNQTIVELWQNRDELEKPFKSMLEETPIIGTLINRYFTLGPEAVSRLPEGTPIQHALVRLFPDVFGVIKNYKKVPEYESENLSWEELQQKMALQGMLWDKNQDEFVAVTDFIPGGLNNEFDFSKDGEWERYCGYMKKYFGLVWDNNVRDFVKPEDLTVGGLNDPDATWEEVRYYNARLGLFWNDETQQFVDISEWPLEEQKVLRYTFFGEQYDAESDTWVQVRNPMKGFGTTVEVEVTESEIEPFLEKVGFIAQVFAAEPDAVRQLVRVPSQYSEASAEEVQLFMKVMDKIGLANYTKPVEQRALKPSDLVPRVRNTFYNNRRTVYTKPTYSKPYQYGSLAGYKRSTSGWPDYDEFYNYEYIYSYKYRNPQRGVADFPQSKLGIQRYMRMRTDALTRKLRLRSEFNVDNSYSVQGMDVKDRLQRIKLHWWMR